MNRGALAAGTTALALLAAVTSGAPSASAAGCSGSAGVTVVVDSGTATSSRCAPGDPASGLAALRASGHELGFVPRQPGFVCTIDAVPATCNGAPPDAYWSYWTAQRGGSWRYSTAGAGGRDPRPGTVEGWAFGAGSPPRTRPPAAVSPPAPRPSTTRAVAPPPTRPASRPTSRPVRSGTPASPPPATTAPAPGTGGSRATPRPTSRPARSSASTRTGAAALPPSGAGEAAGSATAAPVTPPPVTPTPLASPPVTPQPVTPQPVTPPPPTPPPPTPSASAPSPVASSPAGPSQAAQQPAEADQGGLRLWVAVALVASLVVAAALTSYGRRRRR